MLTQGIYHCLLLLINLFLLYSIWRDSYTSFLHFFVLAGIGAFAAVFLAIILTGTLEGSISANFVLHGLAWHGSVFLFVSSLLMYRQRKNDGKPRRCLPSLIVVIGCMYCGLAVDALLLEPTGLVIREAVIMTPKITKPITIVFCSDIQTDSVGCYERRTLQKIKEQNADIILFGGDYVQGKDEQESRQLVKDLNRLFQEVDLYAPLGIYAVQGNFDGPLTEMFENTAIIPEESTVTKQIGEIRLTFLSERDSGRNRSETIHTILDEERGKQFRLMVGHRPRYAMIPQEADLLLAGHTHGGQVQIPFWGPIVTASGDLPRRWASGMTVLPSGATLIVSHGSGLERGRAPRLRFLCRPDFWVIRLVSTQG